MTDKEKLLKLFAAWKIPAGGNDRYPKPGIVVKEGQITLVQGVGYHGFFCDFNFDEAGCFKSFGVWE